MEKFSNLEKQVLDYFFTSSNENDTVYAAKQTLPQEIVGYIIGRASRAKDTFREIFINLWREASNNIVEVCDIRNSNKIILDKISNKALNFLTEYKMHGSLRDLPHVAIFCDKLSILQTKVWEHEVVAEYQEKSTRYRPFIASNVVIPNFISNELIDKIYTHNEQLIVVYNKIYEETNKRDLARYLLPVGSNTAMGCVASIRSWERIVARLISYPTLESTVLGGHILFHIKKVYKTFNIDNDLRCKYKNEFSSLVKTDKKIYGCMSQNQEAIVKKIDGEDVYKINGRIDIGAHRDLQRQRSIIQNFPDYKPLYGYDKLISKYISEESYGLYSLCMWESFWLFFDVYRELNENKMHFILGEAQYLSLLGHMTKFWYITDRDRWQYVHDLRTGAPTQKATNEKTVHFSYSTWCKKVEEQIKRYDNLNFIKEN
jgi:thymidylate synthase ThyX